MCKSSKFNLSFHDKTLPAIQWLCKLEQRAGKSTELYKYLYQLNAVAAPSIIMSIVNTKQ